MVRPSGAAIAPAVWPSIPPPPVRLTTVTGWPSSFPRSTATIRAIRSVPPPAAHGTMNWTGRLGTFAWAEAGDGHVATKQGPAEPPLLRYRSGVAPLFL